MRKIAPHSRAIFYVFVATAIWGLSYPINRHILDQMSPWALSGWRYFFGCLAVLPATLRWRRHPAPAAYVESGGGRYRWALGGFACGALLTCGAGLQLYGLADSTSGKAAFITTLYVLLVPVLTFIAYGQAPRPKVLAGLFMGLAGLVILTGVYSGLGDLRRGDGLILVADIFWAAHVLVMGRFAGRVNPWLFLGAQSLTSCAAGLAIAFFLGTLPSWPIFWSLLPFTAWGMMSVGLAYYLQLIGQRDLPPTATAVVLQFQAVIAAFAGALFLGETLSSRVLYGGLLLLAGALMANLSPAPIDIPPEHKHYRNVRRARLGTAVLIAAGSIAILAWSFA